MKRFFCLLLVLVLFPVVSLADLPDISSLTHDELIELNHQISLRLFGEKLVNGVNVPAGKYIVGEDIPAGIYRLVVNFPDSGGNFYIYDTVSDGMYSYHSFLGSFWAVTEIGKIELKDGNVIEISDNSLLFYPYTGLFN